MSDADTVFDIVFTGELLEGFERAAVSKKMAQLFKISADKADALIQAKRTVLKKGLDQVAAQKYQKILAQTGLVVLVQPQSAPNQPPTASSDSVAESAVDRATTQWQLDEPGALLSPKVEQTVAAVEAPDYTLAAQPCNLLTPEEMSKPAPVPELPNLKNLDLYEAGKPLLEESEKTQTDELLVDLSHLSAQTVGEELLKADEKQPLAQNSIDTSHLKLLD